MSILKAQPLVDGLAFPEGPRWHGSRLWFTDQHAHTVNAVSASGEHEIVLSTEDLPGGLGWLPDGRMLVVYMTKRHIMQVDRDRLSIYADLSGLASFHCNDMVVDGGGRIFAGNFGFDLHGGAELTTAELIQVDADAGARVVDHSVVFPNGSAITPDGRTLLVAETFAHRIRAFELDTNGVTGESSIWADLGEHTPDGICLDVDGALWIASPGTRALIRVQQGGDILDRCETTGTPYACMLGGDDRRMLFACTSETDDPKEAAEQRSGRIDVAQVDIAGAGLP